MANSVWSGHLNFALLSIPVRLTPAARANGISFNMLHKDKTDTCFSRIKQQLVCSECVDEQTNPIVVPRTEIVKGFEYEKNQYVIVEPEEIQAIQPGTSKTMQILEFVDSSEIDPVYFDTSYYITPEEAGVKAYKLLVKALEFGKYYGIAKVCMHNREYTVIIRQSGELLMLHTMFYKDEVRILKEFNGHETEPDINEVNAALNLIVAMTNPWEPGKYSDSFKDELKAMIQAKIAGQPKVEKKEAPKPKSVPNIMDAINASLAEIKAKRGKK